MRKFIAWLDRIAETNQENKTARRLERIAFFFAILTVLSAPHSIAATQTAWLTGMFAWFLRFFVSPRPAFFRSPLDWPLWALFIWSIVTCFTSYAPEISFDKLRVASLFLIFYFVAGQIKNVRAVKFLAVALVFSCMFNVLWTPLERVIGRGVEIHSVAPESALAKASLIDGDTVLKANGKKIRQPEDLIGELERNEVSRVEFYRPDFYLTVNVEKKNLLAGETALEKLGVGSWKKSRNWRSAGFFGHWTTYGEALQLILSLTFGLFVASVAVRKRGENTVSETTRNKILHFSFNFSRWRIAFSPILLFCVGAMSFALLLNVTRASQLAFIVSAFAIVFLVNRKMVLMLGLIFLPVAVGGLIFLQQSRGVGFFDTKDDSIKYRQIVYREGFDLWTENARHFTVGVGMDSIKKYAAEWHLFDDGKLPQGHLHSTPLQLAAERGLPALLLWLWIIWVYVRLLLRGIANSRFQIPDSRFVRTDCKFQIPDSKFVKPDFATNDERRTTNDEQTKAEDHSPKTDSQSGIWNLESGILLGVFGGAVGFFTSGLVHYNLGDSEVAMIFFILMAFGVYLSNSRLGK